MKRYSGENKSAIFRNQHPHEEIALQIRIAEMRNAVSLTYTLEWGYGSGIVVSGAGFLLNNEMGDFNAIPGVTTDRGLIGTSPNLAQPGKRGQIPSWYIERHTPPSNATHHCGNGRGSARRRLCGGGSAP